MEVIVRNLDELADLMLVFLQRLIWLTPRLRTRFAAVLACLTYANTTQSIPITGTAAEPFADPIVFEPAPSQSGYPALKKSALDESSVSAPARSLLFLQP